MENLFLEKSGDGGLLLKQEEKWVPVSVRRCFPWTEPWRWLAIHDGKGKELALVDDPMLMSPEVRDLLLQAIEEGAFVFVVEKVEEIREEFELRCWRVKLQQGERTFQTRLMTWPRELPGGGILIQDISNDLYLVPNLENLDAKSRDLLWGFLDD